MRSGFAIRLSVLIATLSMPLGTIGCVSVATGLPGESLGGVRPSSKAIASKVEPNLLVAVDQSSCVVSKERWDRAKVGEFHRCAWSK